MADELNGRTIAFLVAPEGVEQVELTEPWKAVEATGGTPRLISTESGEIQAFHHLDKADTFPVDNTTDSVGANDFDALVLPGGVANPDILRTVTSAVRFVRGFFDTGKPVAVICHGPWTLVEADVVRGRTLTSWPSVRTDIINAGGTWVDDEVVVCRSAPATLISSRNPDDLAAFNSALVIEFGRQSVTTDQRMIMTTIVIVGGGLAGAKAVEALRDQDFDGDVILFGSEIYPPYERPPLSKEFFAGDKELADFTVHDGDWYRDNKIDVRPGHEITAVDADAHTVTLPDGSTQHYDKLLLATGSSSRHIDLPGSDAAGVHYLRSIDDAEALSKAVSDGGRLAVIGAGWIGLEIAAGARGRGAEVTVVESAPQPLLKALGTELAEVFAKLHRDHGVDLRTGVDVKEITTSDGVATGVLLGDGSTIEADAVLVAVGATPNLALAESAGLDIDGGGVLVSAGLQSSDPDIFVVGDIANAEHPVLGTRVRTEHWANALNQPAVAVANMLGGRAEYSNLPYFFTDQYSLGMEYAGLATDYERVVIRGDTGTHEFLAFWLDADSRVLAGMQVNVWDRLDDIKELITAKSSVDPEALADPKVPLGSLVR